MSLNDRNYLFMHFKLKKGIISQHEQSLVRLLDEGYLENLVLE